MTRIRFIPAQVKTFPDERPDACKRCGRQILTQRGTADKSVTDLYEEKVTTAPIAGAPSGIVRRESTAADRPGGCADGRRSRGRSACRCAPRAICSPPSESPYRA